MSPNDRGRQITDDGNRITDSVGQVELRTLEELLHQLPPMPNTGDSECERLVHQVQLIGRRPRPGPEPDSGLTASPPATGRDLHQLGHYKLLAKLGQGGMGTVYKALHTKLEKQVALKVLPAERMQDPAAVARFEREMRAVGKLAHENIVAALDAGEVDGTFYLVMELVDGADLGTIAREQAPLPVAEACEIIRQAAQGLQHAYENNLVHRDIKPSNLMLAEGPNGPVVKILDMGLALLDEQHTQHAGLTASGQIMGTLDYMAPEQAGDTHTVDIRADIYSLGATLYKLLTGRVPLEGPQYTNTLKKLMALATQDPSRIDALRKDLPAELVEIVHGMIARQPEDRYATPGAVARLVTPFAEGANLAALLEAGARHHDETAQTVLVPTLAKDAGSVNVRSSVVETQPPMPPGNDGERSARPAVSASVEPHSGATNPHRRNKRNVLLACAAVPVVVLLGVILVSLRTQHGEIMVELADGIPAEVADKLKIEVSGNGQVKVADATAGWTIDVTEGKYLAKLTGGGDQFQLEQNQITVSRGKKALLKVLLKPPGEAPKHQRHAGAAPSLPATTPKTTTWRPTAEQQAFFDYVAKLSPDNQSAAVATKLMEVNPGFDGNVEHTIEGGQVTSFTCRSEHLVDIWPIRALARLKELYCEGAGSVRAKLSDLSPLQGMALSNFSCARTAVADLSPLEGMPLEDFRCYGTNVTSLAPLTGMALRSLDCNAVAIRDLSPLRNMPLESLFCSGTEIADISPLQGMNLQALAMDRTWVSDISPLAGTRLQRLRHDLRLFDEDELALIRSLPLISWSIQGSEITPTPQMQKLVEARREAALAFAKAASMLPPSEQPKTVATKLDELNGAGVTGLGVQPFNEQVTDASLVLRGNTPIDVTPLMAFTQLKKLEIIGGRPWLDISCVIHLPLEELQCSPDIAFKNAGVLKKVKTLKTVNGEPAVKYLENLLRDPPFPK